jgi:hypothetical protein
MDLGEITSPTVLFDWVQENARSEADFQQFLRRMDKMVKALKELGTGLPLSLEVNSGTLFLANGDQPTVFFINFNMLNDPGKLTFAIRVDEETGKLCETWFIKPDTPELPTRQVQ